MAALTDVIARHNATGKKYGKNPVAVIDGKTAIEATLLLPLVKYLPDVQLYWDNNPLHMLTYTSVDADVTGCIMPVKYMG